MKYDAARPTGPTATASCCRPATRRCSSTRCSTSPASASSSTTSSSSASGVAHARPPRVPATPPASRSRPVRSARASPTASASRIAERHLRERFGRRGRATTTCSRSAATATSRRASATRPRRSPATSGSDASSTSTTTTTSRSTARPSSPTPTTSRSGSRATAGTSWSSARSAERPRRARARAARRAWPTSDRPTLVVLRSHIGYPSPKYTDTAEAHGNPLGADEIAARQGDPRAAAERLLRRPTTCSRSTARPGAAARRRARTWEQRRSTRCAQREPDARRRVRRAASPARGLDGWEPKLPDVEGGREARDPRRVRGKSLDAVVDVVPGLIGGGADLTGNTGTELKGAARSRRDDFGGRQIHFGIREHGMGAIVNGMARGGALPFGGTFFVFSDYMRPPVRLAALLRAKVAFVWSHDSVGLGEDGPTHQPIEHLASLRAMPGLRAHPSRRRQRGRGRVARAHRRRRARPRIILTRQKVPVLEGTAERARRRRRAGRVRARRRGRRRASTSCSSAPAPRSRCASPRRELLAADGLSVRVVSMPSWDLFDAQPDDVPRRACCRPASRRSRSRPASASAGSATPTTSSRIDHFGASAPGDVVIERVRVHPRERRRARPCAARSRRRGGDDA